MHSADTVYMIIMMRVNDNEGAKELFDHESRRRRNFLFCTNYLRKFFVFQLSSYHSKHGTPRTHI